MSKSLIYAGIGSRNTPAEVQYQMAMIAEQLSDKWLLRSGHAHGADMAFESGALTGNGAMEIFIPWFRFNGAPLDNPLYIRPKATQGLADYAAQFHPAWNSCSDAAKLLHMRNVCQILGEHGDKPASLVICWTPKGLGQGGTGQAIRIAEHHQIPVFDLGIPGNYIQEELCKFIERCES